jgi:endonuclease YncB( thermonuclease family)
MNRSLAFALIPLTATAVAPCPRGSLTGKVTHVRDDDTIVVGTMPIRLNGLAAPEGDEQGGAEATQEMLELVDGRTIRCDLDGERTHDRCVGICYFEGVDIAAMMVGLGLARGRPRFSGGCYQDVEECAAAHGDRDRSRLGVSIILLQVAACCIVRDLDLGPERRPQQKRDEERKSTQGQQ